MDHHHDHHAHMVANTTAAMHHGHHAMAQETSAKSDHSGHGSHMMMMGMTFHGGFKEQILFDQWNTQSAGAFIGSWFLIFFVAILYEGLKTVRDQLAKGEARRCAGRDDPSTAAAQRRGQDYDPANDNGLLSQVKTEGVQSKRPRLLSMYHIVQTLLHILQMGISYLLMLIAMTFNTYLFLAVILGAGFGHFLFGWRRTTVIDYNEHCH